MSVLKVSWSQIPVCSQDAFRCVFVGRWSWVPTAVKLAYLIDHLNPRRLCPAACRGSGRAGRLHGSCFNGPLNPRLWSESQHQDTFFSSFPTTSFSRIQTSQWRKCADFIVIYEIDLNTKKPSFTRWIHLDCDPFLYSQAALPFFISWM